jgi:excisionase family DNA binding protein
MVLHALQRRFDEGAPAMVAYNPNDPDALVTEDAAARFLNVSPRTLQAWRMEKRGPAFVRVGRSIRYRRRDLVEWIERNTHPAA